MKCTVLTFPALIGDGKKNHSSICLNKQCKYCAPLVLVQELQLEARNEYTKRLTLKKTDFTGALIP